MKEDDDTKCKRKGWWLNELGLGLGFSGFGARHQSSQSPGKPSPCHAWRNKPRLDYEDTNAIFAPNVEYEKEREETEARRDIGIRRGERQTNWVV